VPAVVLSLLLLHKRSEGDFCKATAHGFSPDSELDDRTRGLASFDDDGRPCPFPSSAGVERVLLPFTHCVPRLKCLCGRTDFYGTLLVMGSKDKGRKEVKKAPKPKPKPEPGRRQETFTPTPAK
jgi:hypothetical protein